MSTTTDGINEALSDFSFARVVFSDGTLSIVFDPPSEGQPQETKTLAIANVDLEKDVTLT